MKSLALFLTALSLMACTSGCVSAKSAAEAHATARATVVLLDHAWHDTAEACIDLAVETHSRATFDRCRAVLEPAGKALEAAADGVDAWGDVGQKAYACGAAKGAAGIAEMVATLKEVGVRLPPEVADALLLASQFANVECQASGADGG